MDPNSIRNQHETSVWHALFRPQHLRVTNNLAGKQGLSNLQHQRPSRESASSRPRVNLLRLDSQGEDNKSPPILLSCHQSSMYHQSEDNYHNEIRTTMNKSKNAYNSPLPVNQRLQNILPIRTNELNPVMLPQRSFNTHSDRHSSEFIKCAQISSFPSRPNENQMQKDKISAPSIPLTRRLPYFRPVIPVVGLSASAILFGRFKQGARTNMMEASAPEETLSAKNKMSDIHGICQSLYLAKFELAELQKLTMNQHLPQSNQVARPAVTDNKNEYIPDIDIKGKKVNPKDVEEIDPPLSTWNVEQDIKSNECNNQSDVSVQAPLTDHHSSNEHLSEDSSCYFSSECNDEVDDSDGNHGSHDSEDENDEDNEDYSDQDSDCDSSGSISDFESDTESYDASSEYESDSDLESDSESWSSDVNKDEVPVCSNSIISFILGQDSEAAGSKDSGFDEGDEQPQNDPDNPDQVDEDRLWRSFMASGDPYNPISGWKCCSDSPFRRSAPVNPNEMHAKKVQSPSKSDTAEPHYLISDEDTSADVRHPDSSGETKDDQKTQTDKDGVSCPVIKCLLSCAMPSNRTNVNDKSNEINCDAAVGTVVNIVKSCFKNKLSGQQEKQTKKVSFSEKDVSSIAYENPAWYDDYREVRKPYWENFALDRCRFLRRVKEISDAISYCFEPNHRRKIMKQLEIDE